MKFNHSKGLLRRSALAISVAFIALAPGSITPLQAQVSEAMSTQISRYADSIYPALEMLYQDLHRNPELAFQEVQTAARLAKEMRALGFEVTEKVGQTGLVAIYKNGTGPTVMVRTELDALPMEEKSGLSYASTVKTMYAGRESFVAHSCGHDVHMASWVGTAKTLLSMKDKWQGTLMFIGQPAEETVSGAKAMVADGLFKRFPKPDFAFAAHVGPLPQGVIGYNVGAVTSNSDALEITFKGRGGHGSAPHNTIDPIAIAAHFITDVQTVVSREKDPFEFGVVTVGAVQAGTVGNIIPDSAILRGTIRSYKPAVREKLLDGVKRTAKAVAMMAGAPEPEVALIEGGLAIINTEAVVKTTEAVLKAALGASRVVLVPPSSASEDFSVFVNEGIPSMFFSVGGTANAAFAESRQAGGKPLAVNHSPFFAPLPEPSIKATVNAMSLAVLNVLRKP
jgi:amidohydrolase